jgi:hypothetical protein
VALNGSIYIGATHRSLMLVFKVRIDIDDLIISCPKWHVADTSGAGQGRGVDTRFIRSPLVFLLETQTFLFVMIISFKKGMIKGTASECCHILPSAHVRRRLQMQVRIATA